MTARGKLKFAIVGAGKVGSVLGRILVENGHAATAVVSRSVRSARAAGRFLPCRNVSQDLSSIPPETKLVLITTPHGAIAEVAQQLSLLDHLRFRRMAVCHASGMFSATVLEPLRQRGATVFSFHPLQTFPRDFPSARIVPHVRGISYGVDGSRTGLRMARVLARELQGRILPIPPEMRVLYHAACVVASNHLTTVVWIVEQMFRRLGVGKQWYRDVRPILEATLANIGRSSPSQALSGPIARGGTETVVGHCEAVRDSLPELLPYFIAVSLQTVGLAEAKGSVNHETADSMRRALRSFVAQSLPGQEIP